MLNLLLLIFSFWLLGALYIRICKMSRLTDCAFIIAAWFIFIGCMSMVGEALNVLHGHWLITGHILLVIGLSIQLLFDKRRVN